MKKITFIIAILLTINCYSKNNFQKLFQADLPIKATDIIYDESGKIVELVTSTWIDRINTDKGLVYYKYKQGYNYVKKEGFLKTYNDKGKLINENWSKAISGGVAQEEVLIAFELFKKNETVQKQFASTKLDIMLYGGFNFKDDTECVSENRCVHIFASTLDNVLLAHSIVRLTDAKVIYPAYGMDWYLENKKVTIKK